MWVRIPLRRNVLDTTLCDEVCQWLATGRWLSPGIPVSSTNQADHDITEILLKVELNITLTLNRKQMLCLISFYGWGRACSRNHRPVASHWQTSSHNVVSSTFRLSGIRTHICIGSYKSNYHTIMATATPVFYLDNLMRLYKWLIA
jgi:hypothetical protein